MKIIDIDENRTKNYQLVQRKISWQEKFRRSLYNKNFSSLENSTHYQTEIEEEEIKNSAALLLVQNIQNSKGKAMTYQQKKQFYDPQTTESSYSPYSQYIPLSDESYTEDQCIQTFPYLRHLRDTARLNELQNCYVQIQRHFSEAKRKGLQYVVLQWKILLKKLLFSVDSIQALCLFLQVTRYGSHKFDQFHEKYGKQCLKNVMINRICKSALYIRKSLKINKNLKVSIEIGEEITEKTLALTMKTWFCPICIAYDCQRHKADLKCQQYSYQYISHKNKKSPSEHITNIIKLLDFYEQFKRSSSIEQQVQEIHTKHCSQNCYLKLTKKDILGLKLSRHKLISPLAKSLLKMGIQMFSYKPCMIHCLFQSKNEKNIKNLISCGLVFVHLVEEYNLVGIIQEKLHKSQLEHLTQFETAGQEISARPVQPSFSAKNFKKPHYFNKRIENTTPEHALCMHNFIGSPIIDPKCLNCSCRSRGFCLPSCLCSDACQLKRVGCQCKGAQNCQTDKCICYANKLECQPGVCFDCFNSKTQIKKNSCNNDQILRNMESSIKLGISNIPGAGLGAFAAQNIHKNSIICRYSGEHINSEIDHIRQAMIKDLSFYNFDSPNGKLVNASIDARFMGNKARFINHANDGEQNIKAENVFSNGTEYIALYALKDIVCGQQLTFNYDGNGQLYKNHRDKYPFIKPPKFKP